MRRLRDSIAAGLGSILLILCCVVNSARPAPSDSRAEIEYANAYKKLMVAYQDSGNKIMSRPMPPKSAPKAQKRAAVLRHIQDMADINHSYAQRLRRLQPTSAYQEIQLTTEYLFTVSELGNLRWMQAIRSGNQEAQKHAIQKLDESQLNALVKMQRALKRAGGKSEKLNTVVQELQQTKKAH